MMTLKFNVSKAASILTLLGLCGATGYVAYKAIQNDKAFQAHKQDILKHTPILNTINDASFGNKKIELPEDRAFIKNYLMKKYDRAIKATRINDFDNRIEELINLCTDLMGDQAADHLAYLKIQNEELKQREANDVSIQQAKEIANAITSVGSRISFVVDK